MLFGGVTTDHRPSTSCDGSTNTAGLSARDNPNSLRFCDPPAPFRTTVKISAAYQLPWDFQLSGVFMAVPGIDVEANYTVNAAIAGRPILGSTSNDTNIVVNLIEPNSVFLDYRNQFDMRVTKGFRFDRYRLQAFADVFNVLNAGTVLSVNQTFGANPATNQWMTPTRIMDARYVRFGVQMNF